MSHGEPGLHGRQLAQMLRRCRVDAGISGYELARRTYISQTKITRIETGQVAPTLIDVESISQALSLDSEISATLRVLAQQTIPGHRSTRQISLHGWNNRLDALTHLVRSSERVRYFLPAMLVGILQTYEYAYASVYSPAPFSGDQTKVAANKVARQILLDDETIQFTFLLTLSAVSWPLIPPGQMKRQHERLIEISRRPNISLRILDSNQLIREGPLNTFILYDDRILTAELFSGEVTLTNPVDIAFHEKLYDYFLSVSQTEEETRETIARLSVN